MKGLNRVLEQYFRTYINYLYNDWSDWSLLAEFIGNNTWSEITKLNLFFAKKGFHLSIDFEPVKPRST